MGSAWLGGIALAAVAIAHELLLRRPLSVSGRYSRLVDRFRAKRAPSMTQAELVAAMQAATLEAFGELPAPPAVRVDMPDGPRPQTARHHLLFLLGLVAGGALSAALASHGLSIGETTRRDVSLALGLGSLSPLVLLAGGFLVGAGTRMSAGCTSGHGLCGVSQGQKGSLLATATFFGTAMLASRLLEFAW